MKRARPHSSRAGSALVFALIAVSVASMLAAAYLRVSTAVTRTQQQEVENTRAFYLAEAGLAEAYQGLRIGKTGQIASGSAPARFGQGLVWVEATAQVDGRVRLESTGMSGTGRSTLALVVEPVELSLGFFSDEDLVIDDVLLVDGFDSSESTYAEEVASLSSNRPTRAELWSYADQLQSVIGNGTFDKVVLDGVMIDPTTQYSGKLGSMTVEQLEELAVYQPFLIEGYPDSHDPSGPYGGSFAADADPIAGTGETAGTSSATSGTLGLDHTLSGALIGSNGSITLTGTVAGAPEVFGDVLPGPDGQVITNGDAAVTGDTTSRTEPVDLPAVEVPVVDTLPAVLHDSAIPMVISPSSIGYASITVAADAELIVRGPCTLVIGMLELEPGADMLLDTTDGEVTLFVTGGMNLAPDSTVQTSGEQPDEISIQVGEIAAPVGDAPVKLESTAQFHGTIYSPNSAVRVGSSFEVFGAMVAKSLELAPGVRLHFDNAGFEGSPLPKIVRWSIVEIPAVARRRGDPFEGFEVGSLEKLSEAHDLTGIWLTVSYLDFLDNPHTYEGLETDFDWDVVAEVIKSDRAAEEQDDETDPDPPPVEVRTDVTDILSSGGLQWEMTEALIPLSPLSADELVAAESVLNPAYYGDLMAAQ